MEYLARLNIVAMLMSTTFWINLAVVFFVTLITYWLINWLLNVVYKALQRLSLACALLPCPTGYSLPSLTPGF